MKGSLGLALLVWFWPGCAGVFPLEPLQFGCQRMKHSGGPHQVDCHLTHFSRLTTCALVNAKATPTFEGGDGLLTELNEW